VKAAVGERDTVFAAGQVESLAGSDDQHWWFRSKAVIVSHLIERFAPPGQLADIGAGAGGVTGQLAPDRRPLAVEGSPELVAICARRGVRAVQGLARDLPLGPRSVAVVTMLDVIEHLPDPIGPLREARRVLRPDGVLVVTVPAHAWLWSDADELLGHVKRYTRPLLRAELEAGGFRPVWISHVFSWLVAPVYVSRRRPSSSAEDRLGLGADGPAYRLAARALTATEMAMIRRLTLPLGTSIACAARPG